MRRTAVMWGADLLFVVLLVSSVAVPMVLGQSSSGSSSAGSSSSGSGGTASETGGGSGGSGGAGGSGSGGSGASGGSAGSGNGGNGEPPTEDPPAAGGAPGSGGTAAPSPGRTAAPGPSAAPSPAQARSYEELRALVPAVGTVVETTIRTLPPFILLACLVGFVGGPDALPPSVFSGRDAANDVAEVCSMYDLRPLGGGSGLSPETSEREVTLRVVVESTDRIVVEEVPADQDEQRVLLTVLAALLLIALAAALAVVVRRQRGEGPA